MAAPQGLFEFPGLPVQTSGDFTLSRGITPSVLSFNCPPSSEGFDQVADLKITFGGEEIKFKDCAVVTANLRRNRGGYLWSIMIKDYRWKWAYGKIGGRYNVRRDDGSIDPKTEKTPQELAKLLFEQMGEPDADFSLLPNEARPECLWDIATSNPAAELQNMLDELNCILSPAYNGKKTKVWPIGQGKDLPTNGKEINQGFGFSRGIKPDSMEVIGAPVVVQAKFLLEAVGEDTDGTIKPIDELSYTPASGWKSEWPASFSAVTATYTRDGKVLECRELAARTVWKWYRIKKFADETWDVPGLSDIKITKLKSILPISDALLDMAEVPAVEGAKEPKPNEVEGVWFAEGNDYENTAEGTRYPGDFNVDRVRGIVQFSNPAYKQDADGNHSPADLYLTAAFTVRDEATDNIQRYIRKRDLPGKKLNTKPRILNRPEIVRQIIARYAGLDGIHVEDNQEEVNKEADHYLDAAAKEYELEQSLDMEYTGIFPIELDGKVAQVSWSVGGSGARTRASINAEHAKIDSYKERRRREFVAQQAKSQQLMSHQQKVGGDRWDVTKARLA